LAATWLAAALISSLMALLQYFGAAALGPWLSPTSAGEAFANLRQRNQFATAAAALLALGCIGFDCARVSKFYLPAEKRWVAYQQDTLA
jgi:hypothetical protein